MCGYMYISSAVYHRLVPHCRNFCLFSNLFCHLQESRLERIVVETPMRRDVLNELQVQWKCDYATSAWSAPSFPAQRTVVQWDSGNAEKSKKSEVPEGCVVSLVEHSVRYCVYCVCIPGGKKGQVCGFFFRVRPPLVLYIECKNAATRGTHFTSAAVS